MLTVGSLFAGIGGFDLGLERAGMRSVWQCEIDPYAQRVLEKHWPDVLRVPDIRDVGADTVPRVDVICGGFPCQDLSYAGKGAGLAGERSGLWSEYARVIRELRPRYVIVENVSALLARGLDVVLGDLASLRYDAEWDCVPASAVSAPHRRDRLWLVAYPQCAGSQGHGRERELGSGSGQEQTRGSGSGPRDVGDPDQIGRQRWPRIFGEGWRRQLENAGGWEPEPDVGRVAHGVPARAHRLRALGNALVPRIPELIGAQIIDYEGELADAA